MRILAKTEPHMSQWQAVLLPLILLSPSPPRPSTRRTTILFIIFRTKTVRQVADPFHRSSKKQKVKKICSTFPTSCKTSSSSWLAAFEDRTDKETGAGANSDVQPERCHFYLGISIEDFRSERKPDVNLIVLTPVPMAFGALWARAVIRSDLYHFFLIAFFFSFPYRREDATEARTVQVVQRDQGMGFHYAGWRWTGCVCSSGKGGKGLTIYEKRS